MKFFYKFHFKFFLLFFLALTGWKAHSQDIHFSQFYHSPANLNPALTGVFAGDYRFIGNYRSQWASVPVPYRTISGSFDARLQHKFLGNNAFLGYGLVLNNDLAGDANLGLTQVGVNLAYTRQLSEVLIASVGVQLMSGQRSIQPDRLAFEEQWNGDVHDPNLSSNEAFSNSSRGLSSISSGLNLHYQVPGSRTKIDLGTGIFHLNQPVTTFTDDTDVKLPRKGTAYFFSNFQVHPVLDVKVNALFSRQLTYQEMMGGAAIRYHLSPEKNKELALQAGLAFRLKDALIPSVELQVRNWCAGISYDVNYSPFKAATNRQGGLEFFLEYILWKVAAPKEFKACPIF